MKLKAVGEHAVVELRKVRKDSGIFTRLQHSGKVISCEKDKSLEGKTIMFSSSPEYQSYSDYIFVPYNMILCVVDKE